MPHTVTVRNRFTDNDYCLSTLRLGLPAFNIMRQYCGACKSSITNDHWHYLSCVRRRKNELNMRHDQVNRALALYRYMQDVLLA